MNAASCGWSRIVIAIAVPISCPTTMIPPVAWRPIPSILPIDSLSSDVSSSTVSPPRLTTSSHLNAAASSVGARRASSLDRRTPVDWSWRVSFSGSSCSRNAALASVIAAAATSTSGDRLRAVSSAWTVALIASVRLLSSRSPLSNTALMNPVSAPPIDCTPP